MRKSQGEGDGRTTRGENLETPWNNPRVAEEGDGDAERHPFLATSSPAAGPVRLTPGWEDTSPPPFDDILKSNPNLSSHPPKDRFNMVYMILIIHGIGTLMPWNTFINAKEYFVDYKLGPTASSNHSEYAADFLAYVGFAAQIPNVFFNWFNIFVQLGGNLKTRIVWSIVVEAFLLIFTIILAMIDTEDHQSLFFWITMATVIAINVAGGIYQNSIYGVSSKLNYTGAVILGSNISGTFVSIMNIVSKAVTEPGRTSAIYYFLAALFVLLICFDSYFALPLNRFYRYHEMITAKEQETKRQVSNQIGVVPRIPYFTVLKKCLPQCINVFLVFFVTLAIFPTIDSDIKRVDKNFIIPKEYFTDVVCFLTFNAAAMVGSMIPSLFRWPGPRFLWIPVVLRFLLIPFFLFCKYEPKFSAESGLKRILPVYIENDYAYWAGGVVLGVTGGYYSSLAMSYCPGTVESRYAPLAGMFAAAFLVTGIFAGINFSFLAPKLVSSVSF